MPRSRNIKTNPLLDQDTPLIQHIEILSQLALQHGLDEAAYLKEAPTSCATIQQFFGGITLIQCILFSVVFSLNFKSNSVDLEDISRVMKVSTLKIFALSKQFDDLVNRQIIRIYTDNRRHNRARTMLPCIQYYVSSQLVESLWRDETTFCHSKAKSATDVFDLFQNLEPIFQDHVDEVTGFPETINEIKTTFEKNRHISFVTELTASGLDDESLLIILAFCSQYIEGNDEIILPKIISALFPNDLRNQLSLRKEFIRGVHELQQKDLLQLEEDGNFRSDSTAELTEKALQMLLPDDHSHMTKTKKVSKEQNIILHSDIKEKELFFDNVLQSQLDTITDILQPKSYTNLIDRLDAVNMPKGIAILCHGLPGTGKTEFCYQLSRKTKRNLYVVNISETKSMFFGESEKRIKKIFDTYRQSISKTNHIGILLFNECDSVLGTRKKVGAAAVDSTINAIQNILLEEFERLNGIILCTTNLTINLDKAFERRFMFKIPFTVSFECTVQILLNNLPSLSIEEARMLAKRFPLTGGQIANISRKCIINNVLQGTNPDLAQIKAYFEQEILHKSSDERTKIGFIK